MSSNKKILSFSPKSVKRKLFVASFLMSFLPVLLAIYLLLSYAQVDITSRIIVIIFILLVLLITLLGFVLSSRIIELLFKVIYDVHSSTANTIIKEDKELDEATLQNISNSFDDLSAHMHANMMELENYAKQMELLNRKIEEKVDVLQGLHDISKAILTTYDVTKIINLVVEIICNFMKVRVAYIILWDKNGNVVKASGYNADSKKIMIAQSIIKPDIFGCDFERTVVIGSDDYANPFLGLEQVSIETGVVSPIKSRDKVVGAILIGDKESDDRFMKTDFELVKLFCDLTSISIHNAKLYKKLEIEANTDSLTGVRNFRYFQERLKEEVDRARRYERHLSLIMIDVDHFKEYNDNYGHQQGDAVLRAVARFFKSITRASDIIVRYGGDEFMLVLPETDKEGAKTLAHRVVFSTVKEDNVSLSFLEEKEVTFSAGVATLPDDAKECRELVEMADKALYRAKKMGRNRFFYF